MNHQNKIILINLLVSIILLSGCAQLKPSPSYFAYIHQTQRQKELQQINNWSMMGAISIAYNKQREMARFRWEQKQSDYVINISGPLNMHSIRIIGSADNVEMWRGNKKSIKAKTPEQLTQEQLGWQFPVTNIRSWILAQPARNYRITASSFDQYGHLIALEQNGWQIKYSEFQSQQTSNMKYVDLPKTIELRNKEKDIVLKIRIKNLVL